MLQLSTFNFLDFLAQIEPSFFRPPNLDKDNASAHTPVPRIPLKHWSRINPVGIRHYRTPLHSIESEKDDCSASLNLTINLAQ